MAFEGGTKVEYSNGNLVIGILILDPVAYKEYFIAKLQLWPLYTEKTADKICSIIKILPDIFYGKCQVDTIVSEIFQ